MIAGFVAPLLLRDTTPVSTTTTTSSAPPAAIEGLLRFPGLSRSHVTGPVTYPQNPPAGGDHDPVWLNCGYYAAPVRNENAVHSMEHGAVWITYRPDLTATQVTTLRDAAHGLPYLLVSPYEGLPAPVVASAWGVQVRVESVDDPRLTTFVDQFRSGPQAPERGSPCEGGTGTPG